MTDKTLSDDEVRDLISEVREHEGYLSQQLANACEQLLARVAALENDPVRRAVGHERLCRITRSIDGSGGIVVCFRDDTGKHVDAHGPTAADACARALAALEGEKDG